MSEDIATKDTDLAGDRQAPGGIYQLGDAGDNYVSLEHIIHVICDSRHGWFARLLVRREAAQSKRKRVPCPCGCGRMGTVYVSNGGAQ